ncbi:MAG: hypothetical protein LBT25_07780 [Candidatus Symbiothrix sp.]|jgi:hypothetical protein|nr:hypothetical protein [Candidatus Symbiothrix sp.]
MLKHIFKKARLFFLLIAMSVGIFSACSVPKYAYYYATLKTNNPEIKKIKQTRENEIGNGVFHVTGTEYALKSPLGVDSALIWVELLQSKGRINIDMEIKKPAYFDFQQSKINFNETSYKIIPSSSDSVDENFKINPSVHRLEIGYIDFPISMVNELYERYDDTQYKMYNTYTIGDKNSKKKEYVNYYIYSFDNRFRFIYKSFDIGIPSIEFSKENSPLKINIELVYYSDSTFTDQKTISLDFYQTSLMKLDNMRSDRKRYNGTRHLNEYFRGDVVGLEIEDVSFYTKNKSGTIWGWPEFRRGLGWGATVILPSVDI